MSSEVQNRSYLKLGSINKKKKSAMRTCGGLSVSNLKSIIKNCFEFYEGRS